MGKYRHFKISLMLFILTVIGFSLSSCMIFFMGDFTEYLIDEDFNDGIANNWMPNSPDWWVGAGEYRMVDTTAAIGYTNSHYSERLFDENDHFTYQATFTQYGVETTSNKCGLIFRSDNPWDVNVFPLANFQGYLLWIRILNGAGSDWGLERGDGVASIPLVGGTNDPNINDLYGDKNVIKIECEGSLIKVYFNGEYITSWDDGSYMGGHAGLFAQSAVGFFNSYGFDDVELSIPREYRD